jgi:hypothetical protein
MGLWLPGRRPLSLWRAASLQLGMLHGVVVLFGWVECERDPHLFSIRKAKKHEQKRYLDYSGN